MGKRQNKEKQRQKRRRAKAERRRKKKAEIGARVSFRLPGVKPGKLPGLDAFSDVDHLFWVAHGINFIASDYAEAIWQPLFPGIYEGKLPTEEELAQRVMVHWADDLGSPKPTVGKVATAWAVQDKATVFSFACKAVERLEEADPGMPEGEDPKQHVRRPHHSASWRLFDEMKQAVLRDMATP
jgi:hypothetical protein